MRATAIIGIVVAWCLATLPVSARQDTGTTISVAGRSSQTPWAVALGDVVVVAFGAQTPQGKADVFAAVSR